MQSESKKVQKEKQVPYICTFCFKRFQTKYEKVVHERIHTGEKPFKCKFCTKAFTQKSGAKMHEKTHTGEKRYKCNFCYTWTITEGRVFSRSPESIADELETIEEEDVYIVDDIFLLNYRGNQDQV